MARILIVDDSAVARKTLSSLVISLGHAIVGEASNGIQAFDEYARLKPDVVTMDLTMAGRDGAEATSEIMAAFPEARIIVISARQEHQVIIDALERGARHFVIKPVSLENVSAVLNNVLQQSFDKQKQVELVRNLKESFAAPRELAPREPVPREPTRASTEGRKISSARMLIVDDSAVARKCLKDIVTALGHVVVGEASNGAQAFVEYNRLKPDVVTMDLTMQGLGGAEATTKIIAAHPEARIIVISAMEARQGIIDALERGARHFIVKPIRQEKVAVVLNSVLQQDFDLRKHRDNVRKLKEAEESKVMVGNSDCKFTPPYVIVAQGNKLVHVAINQCLTLNSYQSLNLELEEHLTENSRVLFDFGTMARIDQELLIKLNELIKTIESSSGMVKAISNNKQFVEEIAESYTGKAANLMAEVLRYVQS